MVVQLNKKHGWLLINGMILFAILVLSAWIFGWGRGNINVIGFSTDEVERIELSCTDTRVGLHNAVVTEKNDIQALINSVNSFQHTGSAIKELFRHGIGIGGTILYEYNVYLSNGDVFHLCFGSNNGEQKLSNMEVNYWISDQAKLLPDTCKGSMELFYELYDKYRIME